jgi:protein-tyrosine phosphatase
MDPDSALALSGLGVDAGDFVARLLTPELASSADLTLAMTGRHRHDIVGLAPRRMQSTFTLLEAAELLGELPDDVALGGGGPVERLRELVRLMNDARTSRRGRPTADVRDPIGLPLAGHQETGQAISDALDVVLPRLVAAVVRTGR